LCLKIIIENKIEHFLSSLKKNTEIVVLFKNMKEIKNSISFYDNLKNDCKLASALATVVRVEGSSYRRTGARMLVCENGTWMGGISGGCLEGDALKKARMAIFKGKPTLVTYDTTKDDEHQIGVGLGCNGIIDVLFVPLNYADNTNPIEILRPILNNSRLRKIFLSITKISESHAEYLGKTIMYNSENDLSIFKSLFDISKLQIVLNQMNSSQTIDIDNETRLFVEVIVPPLHVFVFGHQYDLYPLANMVLEMGWELTIIAETVKIKGKYQVVDPQHFDFNLIDKNSAVILMAHSLITDKNNLAQVVFSNAKYIGLLGPKSRSVRIFEELTAEKQLIFTDELKTRIFAPVGLDLGATNPEAIALSIVAEIKMVFSGRSGQSLRDRITPINERSQTMIFN
jgi:xanthine dehydrogenase accessory factor